MSKSRYKRERPPDRAADSPGRRAASSVDPLPPGPAPLLGRFVIHSRWTVLGLSLTSMVLLSLCFEPINFWPLVWVALIPWTVAIAASARFGWMLFCSWLAGFLFFAVNLYWLLACGYPGPWGGVLLMAAAQLALAAFMGVFFLLFAYVIGGLVRRWGGQTDGGGSAGVLLAWALPIAWVGMEVFRGYVLSGFPWFLLAHSLHRQLALIQIADLGGAYAVSFLIAAVNGLLADLLLQPLLRRSPRGWRLNLRLSAATAGVAALVLCTMLYGHHRIGQFDPAAAPGPRVAVIQDYVPISLYSELDSDEQLSDDQKRFGDHLALSADAAAADPAPDMVAWPETMVSEPVNDEFLSITWGLPRDEQIRELYGEEIDRVLARIAQARRLDLDLRAQVDRHGVALLVGAAAIVPEPPGWTDESAVNVLMLYSEPVGPPTLSNPQLGRYNSAILYQPFSRNAAGMRALPEDAPAPATAPDATIAKSRYDKHHLVPFSELLPFRRSWPAGFKLLRRLTPMSLLQAGQDRRPLTLTGRDGRRFRFAAPICYEDVMPQAVRRLVRGPDGTKQVDFLVNISNDGWFAGTTELKQHWSTAVFRCIEFRVPMARSVNCGCSGFISPVGRPLGRLEPGERGHLSAVLPLDARATVYMRIGDGPGFACLGLFLAGWAAVLIRRRRARHARRAG